MHFIVGSLGETHYASCGDWWIQLVKHSSGTLHKLRQSLLSCLCYILEWPDRKNHILLVTVSEREYYMKACCARPPRIYPPLDSPLNFISPTYPLTGEKPMSCFPVFAWHRTCKTGENLIFFFYQSLCRPEPRHNRQHLFLLSRKNHLCSFHVLAKDVTPSGGPSSQYFYPAQE